MVGARAAARATDDGDRDQRPTSLNGRALNLRTSTTRDALTAPRRSQGSVRRTRRVVVITPTFPRRHSTDADTVTRRSVLVPDHHDDGNRARDSSAADFAFAWTVVRDTSPRPSCGLRSARDWALGFDVTTPRTSRPGPRAHA
jgi:hypothetical protein